MATFLALDAGTGSCRAVLFNGKGEQLAIAAREWIHKSIPNIPGSMEFDLENNWRLLSSCIREVILKTNISSLDAISTTSMREGIVLYDKEGNEIWACANVDSRSSEEVRYLRQKGLEKEFYFISGQTFALGAAPRLLWLKNNQPDIFEKAYYVVMLSDWIAIRLGAKIAVDPSNAGTSGLFDLQKRNWSTELLQKAGLNLSIANTPVFNSGEVIGYVSQKVAKELSIASGIPIVMGGGDAQLGAIGVGAVYPKNIAIFGGTFWQQEFNFSKPPEDSKNRIRINFHAVPGLWQAETIVFFAGLAARWMRDAFFPDIKEKALATGQDPYTLLEELAKDVPIGSNAVIPIFSNAMDYSHWIHASPSFVNLMIDPEKCNRITLFRSILENTAIVVRANIEQIVEIDDGKWPSNAIMAGGAAKGILWPKIVADALGIPITIPVVKESTALGAAICAGVGVGYYRSFQQAIEKTVSFERTVEPDLANTEKYQNIMERWKIVYEAQLELAKKGLTEPMWRAPGE
jgi:autoinducer 2 (AI-2) kinase